MDGHEGFGHLESIEVKNSVDIPLVGSNLSQENSVTAVMLILKIVSDRTQPFLTPTLTAKGPDTKCLEVAWLTYLYERLLGFQ